jgi:hypothetical protein
MTAGSGSVRGAGAARVVAIAGLLAGAAGLVLGFARLPEEPAAVRAAALGAVGVVGALAFVRHVLFARADAARIGWAAAGGSGFQLETGFANLGFALAAALAVLGDWGTGAYAAVTLGYGLYLAQGALLHLRDARRPGYAGNLWTGVVGSLAMAACLIFFAAHALHADHLAPF